MISLEVTEKQLDELYAALLSNASPSARKKCLIVYLRAKGYSRDEIADIARIDLDTVTHQVKRYASKGLQGLLKSDHQPQESQLTPYTEQCLEALKKNRPTR